LATRFVFGHQKNGPVRCATASDINFAKMIVDCSMRTIIDTSKAYFGRTLSSKSTDTPDVALAGEFCTHVGICKTCYRKGTCWCATQSEPKCTRMPNNSEMIQRRLIAKQRNR